MIPAVPYLQALGLSRDQLVQALGLSFTVSTLALAAGLWCSRLDGSPLRYNRPNPFLPDLLICRPELAADALDALARFTG